ncbi:MAG: carboxypeptidase regulatory-like domain-containing protein, partial [Planctomycetes bacterium]|nr:carboxypeptidase regulatory-like domain-containing protein [Planctomycetota bacterium]
MPATRSLAFAALLLALGGAAYWWLQSGPEVDVGPSHVPAAPASADPDRSAASAVPVETADSTPPDRADRTAVAGGSRATAEGPALVGTVVDERGTPIAGAVVRCGPGFGPGSGATADFDFGDFEDFDPRAMTERMRELAELRAETITSADGRFRLVPTGQGRNVMVRVAAVRHQVLDRTTTRPGKVDNDLGTLVLRSGATVRGRVVDAGGSPIAGARVQRVGARGRGGSGPLAALGGGPDGDGPDFSAMLGGFEDADFNIPGAEVWEQLDREQNVVTDAEGRFELPHCPPGDFGLRARHVDHPLARKDDLSVPPGGALDNVLVAMAPGATIRGRIVGVPEGHAPLRVMASQKREPRADRPGDETGMGGMFSAFVGEAGDMLADAGLGFGERQVDAAADQTFELRGLQLGKAYRLWAVPNGRGFAGQAVCTQRLEVQSGSAGIELVYDPGIAVTLTVVDRRTKAPVERLWVRDQLRGGGGMADMMAFVPRATRNKFYPEGKVTVANLRPKAKQTLSLTVEAIGYQRFERRDLTLPASGTLDLGTVALEPAPVVQLTVVGPEGRPLAGAQVRLREVRGDAPGGRDGGRGAFRGGDIQAEDVAAAMAGGPFGGLAATGPRSGKTDAEGRCTLNAFAGASTVTVTAKDLAPHRSDLAAPEPGAELKHEVQMLRGGTVVVTVVGSDGKPLAAVRVEHRTPGGDRDTREADEAGVVRFEHLAPGEHGFRLTQRGGGPLGVMDFGGGVGMRIGGEVAGGRNRAEAADWQTVAVADAATSELRLEKAATATVVGVVRENGVPLAGVRLAFVEGPEDKTDARGAIEARVTEALGDFGGGGGGRGRTARTGEDGTFQLKELPAGAHRLRITANGRAMPTTVPVQLQLGDNTCNVDLVAATLRGRVTDSAGQPVAGATVALAPVRKPGESVDEQMAMIEEGIGQMGFGGRNGSRSVRTGDDGFYELKGVELGVPLQVRVTARGYASALSAVVEVPQEGLRTGVDVVVGAAGKVRVEVAGAGMFAALRAVKVGADGERLPNVPPVTQVLRGGKGTLDGLSAGRWQVSVEGMDGQTREPRVVEVVVGQTVNL